ncbi:MAG: class I SAM-dependent methyltransferase [Aquamicrobium sp.]|nr:class I SAM-dependent methyltransferase [Mesorhizobium sp. Pch-S]MBR2692327.1 class I SAM-dependent methyltransferase [Aquamicrobium sp.]
MAVDKCPICGGSGSLQMSVSTPYLDKQQRYDVLQCSVCRHRWCAGDTSDALLTEIYSKSFHQTTQQLAENQSRNSSSPIILNSKARAEWLCQQGHSGTLLDVGAGNGYFVREANEVGFKAEGLDIAEEAAVRAASLGVTVRIGNFLADDVKVGKYDVITMWDVLCGFPDVNAAIAKVARHLEPGGALVLTIADGQSSTSKLAGRYWPLLIPPVNLHYFSEASTKRLLESYGMEILSYKAQGKWLSVRFLWQKLLRTLRITPLETVVSGFISPHWKVKLNLGDIVTVVARLRPTSG